MLLLFDLDIVRLAGFLVLPYLGRDSITHFWYVSR